MICLFSKAAAIRYLSFICFSISSCFKWLPASHTTLTLYLSYPGSYLFSLRRIASPIWSARWQWGVVGRILISMRGSWWPHAVVIVWIEMLFWVMMCRSARVWWVILDLWWFLANTVFLRVVLLLSSFHDTIINYCSHAICQATNGISQMHERI